MTVYQTFLPDCDCKSGGILFRDNKPCCRWCLKPWGDGGMINYTDDSFKASHTPKEEASNSRDWEIVEFRIPFFGSDNVAFTIGKHGLYETGLNGKCFSRSERELIEHGGAIKSVRRLSDGEVFSIGDVIKFHSGVEDGAIEKFRIDGFDKTQIFAYRSYAGVGLLKCQKVSPPKPQPLFVEKPPIGLMPEHLHKEQRLTEIKEALQRYAAVYKVPPIEWIAEQYSIELWLESKNKSKQKINNK